MHRHTYIHTIENKIFKTKLNKTQVVGSVKLSFHDFRLVVKPQKLRLGDAYRPSSSDTTAMTISKITIFPSGKFQLCSGRHFQESKKKRE